MRVYQVVSMLFALFFAFAAAAPVMVVGDEMELAKRAMKSCDGVVILAKLQNDLKVQYKSLKKLLNRGNATEAAVSQTVNRIHETVDLTTAHLANSTIGPAKRQAASVVLTTIIKDLADLRPLLPRLTQYDSFDDDFARFDYSVSRLLLAVESSRNGVLAFVSQRVRCDRPLLVNLHFTLTLQTLNITASVNGTRY